METLQEYRFDSHDFQGLFIEMFITAALVISVLMLAAESQCLRDISSSEENVRLTAIAS